MGRVHGERGLGHHSASWRGDGRRPEPISSAKVGPLHILHDQVRQTIRRVDHRVDRDRVIVLEPRRKLRLPDQAQTVGSPGMLGS